MLSEMGTYPSLASSNKAVPLSFLDGTEQAPEDGGSLRRRVLGPLLCSPSPIPGGVPWGPAVLCLLTVYCHVARCCLPAIVCGRVQGPCGRSLASRVTSFPGVRSRQSLPLADGKDCVLAGTSDRCPPFPRALVPAIPGFDVVTGDPARGGPRLPHPVWLGRRGRIPRPPCHRQSLFTPGPGSLEAAGAHIPPVWRHTCAGWTPSWPAALLSGPAVAWDQPPSFRRGRQPAGGEAGDAPSGFAALEKCPPWGPGVGPQPGSAQSSTGGQHPRGPSKTVPRRLRNRGLAWVSLGRHRAPSFVTGCGHRPPQAGLGALPCRRLCWGGQTECPQPLAPAPGLRLPGKETRSWGIGPGGL